MSILDKASLIQIPSGYKSGKLYSIKPDNGDGDFTFSRSSSATRVNSEGLIETAQIVSETELVTNGDFSGSSTGWTESGTWTYGDNNEVCTGNGTNQVLTQSSILTTGKKYKYSIDIISSTLNSQQIRVYLGGTDYVTYTLNGGAETISAYAEAAGTNLAIRVTSSNTSGVLTIDNVSVKEVVENDIPRLDYSDESCPSLLLEPQRTNNILQSNQFDTTWVTNTATIEGGQVGVGNSNDAWLLTRTGTNGRIYQTTTSSGTQTLSIYAKSNTNNWLFLVIGSSETAYYDLENGVIGTTSSSNIAKIEPIGNNGWYRCSLTFTHTNPQVRIQPALADNNVTGSGSIYIQNAQLEQGSYDTSYIPTTSASTTRTADVCNNAGTSATFNSTEGVLFAEISALYEDGSNRYITISDGSVNNRLVIRYIGNNQIGVLCVVGGSVQLNLNPYVDDITINSKVALKYKQNDFAMWIDGFKIGVDTSGYLPSVGTFNRLNISGSTGASSFFYGKVKQLMVFNEALSDEELSDLTGQVNLSFNNLATFYNYTIL